VSLWIVLATVIPGLVTIATVYTCLLVAAVPLTEAAGVAGKPGEWALFAIAATVMVLTQALGVLLETVLTRGKLLCSRRIKLKVPAGVRPSGPRVRTIKPYDEYAGVYVLLASLGTQRAAHGHVERANAQFFLTNNTLVSFTVGLVLALGLSLSASPEVASRLYVFSAVMLACLGISYWVAVIRFRVMTRSLWAARATRTRELAGSGTGSVGRVGEHRTEARLS